MTTAGARPLDSAARTRIIEAVLTKLDRYYVFPDVAQQMAQAVRGQLRSGAYDAIVSAPALCDALTTHLQAVSQDRHLTVVYRRESGPVLDATAPPPDILELFRQHAVRHNYGFERVERLAGNIGYVDLRMFFYPEFAGATADAAMTLLANTAALIVDVRQNHGGQPEMIALLCSYLVPPEPVQLSSFYLRDGDRTQQFWTLRYVVGPRYVDKPVYVLVSQATFSGAEAFAYDLQALGRATLVGEPTAGGAHPVMLSRVEPHIEVNLPMGRPINPLTGGNWEGTGVIPNIAASSDDALRVAYLAALHGVLTQYRMAPTDQDASLVEEAEQAVAELHGGAPV